MKRSDAVVQSIAKELKKKVREKEEEKRKGGKKKKIRNRMTSTFLRQAVSVFLRRLPKAAVRNA